MFVSSDALMTLMTLMNSFSYNARMTPTTVVSWCTGTQRE